MQGLVVWYARHRIVQSVVWRGVLWRGVVGVLIGGEETNSRKKSGHPCVTLASAGSKHGAAHGVLATKRYAAENGGSPMTL